MEERRTTNRFSDIPVTIQQCVLTHLGKETWLTAEAFDLSSRGLSLLLPDSLNSGESVYILAVVQPEGKAPRDLEVNGVTSYCRPQDGELWRVGVRFLDLTEEEQHEWDVFLAL